MSYRIPLFLLGLAALSPARAETINCTPVATVPTTITTQGIYCLTADLSTAIASGSAIQIDTNNVTLDCNGYKLGGLAAGAGTTAVGISASGRSNITVRNCSVRGFRTGLSFSGSGHAVEDSRFDANTRIGVKVVGDGSVIQRNLVLNTGGNTANQDPRGIETSEDVDVLDNTIAGVTATGGSGDPAYGIFALTNTAGSVSDNRIRNVLADGAGSPVGIWAILSTRMTISGNHLSNPATSGYGILCDGVDVTPAVKNVVNGYASGIDTDCVENGNVVN
ncbi:MAG TPA: hypothetical protein VGD21_13685 [Lysobacter sp.]